MKTMVLSLSLCAFLMMTTVNLFAQQENINNTEIENAAVYYLKAIELLKYPDSQEIKNKLQITIKNGWQEENKELENILYQNEVCLNEFKKGLLLKRCDFDFGKKYKYLATKELPPLVKLRDLSNLLFLRARYYEGQGNFNDAIDSYLSLLTFARHISQDNTAVLKIMALKIEENTYVALGYCLNSGKIDKGIYLKILTYLEDYEKQHFPVKQIIDAEKEVFKSNLQLVGNNIIEAMRGFSEDEKKIATAFADEILKQGIPLADKYYGVFIKAAETNNEDDWQTITAENEELQKEVQISNIEESLRDIGNIIKNRPEDINEKLASQFAKYTLVLSSGNLLIFRKMVDNYYSTLKELKELKSLVNIKIREMAQ